MVDITITLVNLIKKIIFKSLIRIIIFKDLIIIFIYIVSN